MRVAAEIAPRVRVELASKATAVGIRAAAEIAPRVRAEIASEAAAVGVRIAAEIDTAFAPN